ncbi:MAG: UDP-glucose/GDP-mannose dehydrogenase family protein [Alphaproteobacteria bacterium]|nr:UDP-glucose/GDP-mannose dehydrogenase family protein [Alphaproteobacteria bacterium]
MRVAMIGTGYVGLVSGACFSNFGHHVVCVDKDESKIARLNRGEIPIFEPGLDALVADNVKAGRLSFTTDLKSAVPDAEAVFIAVGTPSRRGDGFADLTYVWEAAAEIADALKGYTVIVTKSTVPVSTCSKVEAIIRERNPAAEFDVASNPEFLREGSAIEDFQRPDRVVVGTESERARNVMRALYRPLFLNDKTPFVFTTREASELIKYASNAFLAMKITFINEMADLCERAGADIQDVARGIGLDGRIGSKFLNAGPGYGGSCFPKDTLALVRQASEFGVPSRIIESVIDVNANRKKRMADKIIDAFGGVKGKTVAILGVTFKPNTDDMRDSPSLDIIPAIQQAGATVRAFDPEGMAEAEKLLPGVKWTQNGYEAMTGADGVAILTEWNEFRALDFARTKALLKRPLMVDLRNIYTPREMLEAGFEYHSVGRTAVKPENK